VADIVAAEDALSRVRKERVHTTMLIEVLALLVFLSMAFAFVLKEEGDRLDPWKEKADRLEHQLAAQQRENASLRRQITSLQLEIDTLEASIRRLVAEHTGTLPPTGYVTLSTGEVSKWVGRHSNDQAMLEELRRENAALRAQLQAAHGKGGTDLPNCPVTAGFLLSIDVYGDGTFAAHPAWNSGAADIARRVPGVPSLSSGRQMDRSEFASLAGQVAHWGRGQPIPCGFRTKVTEHHGDLALYKRQVALVEQYFYVRRN
jgi:hypothetical protein